MGMQDKVIITAALTGVLANRDQCPAIPYTPAEIAEEARRAWEAGASVAHIHAREPETGAPTFDKAIYEQIMIETRKRCPIIINFSTGGIGIPMEDRVAHIRDLRPEIGALNMGSMNYAKYSAKRKSFVFDFVFSNPFGDIIFLLEQMNAGNVKPELECFDTGHIYNAYPLIDMGLLKKPLQFSFIMGVLGGQPANAEALSWASRQIPPDSTWEVIGISHEQWMLVAAALALGGNIRVGLEDNFYVSPGVMAKSNGDLVEKAARMTRDMGREPATVEEARKLLSLPPAGKA
ncbi:MAG: 3-keto-5-aminohexanoate cleavage enzyme [Myxococcota bacterium]|nr:3-keto-5-aminohexanoate cleavage enzyme [Myxococcota bacterium]